MMLVICCILYILSMAVMGSLIVVASWFNNDCVIIQGSIILCHLQYVLCAGFPVHMQASKFKA